LPFSVLLYGLSFIFFLAQWKIAGPGFHHEARIGTLRHTTTVDVWFGILTDCGAIRDLSACCQFICLFYMASKILAFFSQQAEIPGSFFSMLTALVTITLYSNENDTEGMK